MKRNIRLMVFAMLALFASVATATTYQYTGAAYTTVGVGGVYSTSMRLTGTITTASPLPANMPPTAIGPGGKNWVTAWSFTDDVNTFTQANSMVLFGNPGAFTVGTGADGNINVAQIALMAPPGTHTVGESMNYFLFFDPAVGDLGVIVVADGSCTNVRVSDSVCTGLSPKDHNYAAVEGGGTWAIREMAPVPTLNSVFLAALAVGLAALSYLSLRRRI